MSSRRPSVYGAVRTECGPGKEQLDQPAALTDPALHIGRLRPSLRSAVLHSDSRHGRPRRCSILRTASLVLASVTRDAKWELQAGALRMGPCVAHRGGADQEDVMTRATSTPATADSSSAVDDTSVRRARGLALIAGAVIIVALIETQTIPFYWFPVLTGLTYLAAAGPGAAAAPCGHRASSSPLSASVRPCGCATAARPTASSSLPWPSWRSASAAFSRPCWLSCAGSRSVR